MSGDYTPDTTGDDDGARGASVSILSVGLVVALFWLFLFIGLVRADAGLAGTAVAVLLLAHGTRLWARMAARGLDISLSVEEVRVFPGEELPVTVALHNKRILPLRARICLSFSGFNGAGESLVPSSSPETGKLELTRYIHPFEGYAYRKSFSAPQRGIYVVGPAVVYAGDAPGLSEASSKGTDAVEVVVYPRVRPMITPDTSFQEYFGIHAAKGPIEDPAWYAGTREYSGNRPARHIHWKASARLGVLQEKIFEPTSHRKVLFVLDVRGYRRDGGTAVFETALEVIASLASVYMESGASIGIVTNGKIAGGTFRYIPLGRGPEQLGMILELLARVTIGADKDLEELLPRAGRGGTGFVYVGYSPDDRTKLFFGLPAAQRKRILFIFSQSEGTPRDGLPENLAPHLSDVYPAYVVADLLRNLPGEDGG